MLKIKIVTLAKFVNYTNMKHYRLFIITYILIAIWGGFTACTESNNTESTNGITAHSWTDGTPIEIKDGAVLSVSFTAEADWTASSSASWCSVVNNEGQAGQNTIKLKATANTGKQRTATIAINVNGHTRASFQVVQKGTGAELTGYEAVNTEVDKYLSEYYLWNNEYNTLSLDYSQNYEDFFYGALRSMTTNTLDKKITEDGSGYTLFSYIEQVANPSRSGSTKPVSKELTYNFGIASLGAIRLNVDGKNTIYLYVQSVYYDSPAARAGLKRGDMIKQVNGTQITQYNYAELFYELISPTSATSVTLTEDIFSDKGIIGENQITMTAEAMYCNPVLMNAIEDTNGHKIGYLAYSAFDAGFDAELFDVFKLFKQKGVTDLVLDLRYNSGGHTISANLISTCIAGAAARGKVFMSLRYNDERMKRLGGKREEETFMYDRYANLETSLADGALNLNRVYCLVGNGTASSSELVINALRGIDVDVVLIGETTLGKNVGMEPVEKTVNGTTYNIVPITFQSYNAKGFTDYDKGFKPTYEIDELNPEDNGIFHTLQAYGSYDDPLYAKAVELITGVKRSVKTRTTATNILTGKPVALPEARHIGRFGMIKVSTK